MEDNKAVVYTKVALTLSNVQVPSERLLPNKTPSSADGLTSAAETDLRLLGCELIQTSGILLKLPQTAMATGHVLFQRFYYSKSFIRYSLEHLAMASINLASKIDENPRRIRDVINVFHHIKQVRSGKTIRPMLLDHNYVETKNQVIKAERRILKELGFCVYVKHPHKIIILYLRVLMMEKNRRLAQTAWNFMNDSLWTDLFLRYSPESIACACIYLAARKLKIPLPSNPPWFKLFSVKEVDIRVICVTIIKLYSHKTQNLSVYEKLIAELKEKQDEEKRRQKERALISNIIGSNEAAENKEVKEKKSVNLPFALDVTKATAARRSSSAVAAAAVAAGNSNSVSSKSSSRHSSPSKRKRRRSSSYSDGIDDDDYDDDDYDDYSASLKKSSIYHRSNKRTRRTRTRTRTRSRSRDRRYKKSKEKLKLRRKSRSPSPIKKKHRRHSSKSRGRRTSRYDKIKNPGSSKLKKEKALLVNNNRYFY